VIVPQRHPEMGSPVPDQISMAPGQPAVAPKGQITTRLSHSSIVDITGDSPAALDPEQASKRVLRDLRSSAQGLSTREAERRLLQYGPNTLQSRHGRQWPAELARQFTHPLALLLWLAAGLLLIVGSHVVAAAVVSIIGLNAAFSFVQELQAERAVEELAKYLPQRARVERDGAMTEVEATRLVPGDIVKIQDLGSTSTAGISRDRLGRR